MHARSFGGNRHPAPCAVSNQHLRAHVGYMERVPKRFPHVNTYSTRLLATSELPAETGLSKSISKDLKRRGFRFVGPTVIYAFMQAVGMVNDHTIDCFRYKPLARKS